MIHNSTHFRFVSPRRILCGALLALALLAGPALLFTFPAHAEDSQVYVWYDGATRHEVYLQPDLIAALNGSDEVARLDRGARVVEQTGAVRIYRVQNTAVKNALEDGQVAGALSPLSHSPVFSSNPEGGMLRALPGGVILVLNSGLSESAAQAWLAARGLSVKQKLPVLGNFYEIVSPPGLASLTLANQLRTQAGVQAAYPNWWTEHTSR